LLYLFEDFALDTGRCELRRGSTTVAVEPQVFDLLVYLVRNRDRVVSKDDLLAAVWHGRIVSDATVDSRVNAARRAVGDNGDEQRLIKTLPRKGIRFLGAVRERDAADAAPSAAAEPRTDTSPIKVLVVDDHVLIRDALRGVLTELNENATVLDASDCRQAMHVLAEHADLDLILLDLGLPDRDGFSVLADLREGHPGIPVVVLSAFSDRDNVVKALDLGATGFIAKSAQRKVMLSALEIVFSGGIYVPPEILGRGGSPAPAMAPAAAAPAADPVAKPPAAAVDLGLTERQLDVLALMMRGKSNKAICRALNLAETTVKIHVTAILRALKATNRTEAVIAAAALGWNPPRAEE